MIKFFTLHRFRPLICIAVTSLIYLIVFIILYSLLKKPVLTLVSIIPVSYIAWRFGRVAGISTTIINFLVTMFLIEAFDPGKYRLISIEPFMGFSAQLLFALAIGTFGVMTRRLNQEISERKNAEVQLNNYKTHLEEIVEQRTNQLEKTNARLRQIEKMEIIGQLAGGIAHDFNNQLSIIMGYTEIINRNISSDERLINYLTQIQTASKRAAGLTKQLLAFARKDVYKMEAVNIHLIIKEVISLLSHTINKNIIINATLNASKYYIWGGPNQIQNAILNLALNARDSMPDGGNLTFTTKTTEIDDAFNKDRTFKLHNGTYISIDVSDTGTGMNDEVLNHLFEPFFTTKEEGKGTGMGLAATYGIVKSHKGAIEVHSTEGKGTSFTLHFPVTNKPHESELLQKIKHWDGKKLNLLIIDDEQLVALTIKEIISSPDIIAHTAFSGDEGIRIYKEQWQEIDIVIIDMIMPNRDGKQTFLELKKINPNIKAIISSGFALNLEIEQTINAGACSFIQKPYNKHELLEHIEKIINKN
ncbi:MAG: response regulator [Fibrobacter sp.]|nr:response regulator [Fibrobacter sp.]